MFANEDWSKKRAEFNKSSHGERRKGSTIKIDKFW